MYDNAMTDYKKSLQTALEILTYVDRRLRTLKAGYEPEHPEGVIYDLFTHIVDCYGAFGYDEYLNAQRDGLDISKIDLDLDRIIQERLWIEEENRELRRTHTTEEILLRAVFGDPANGEVL